MPPVSKMASTWPHSTAAMAPASFATWYSMASHTLFGAGIARGDALFHLAQICFAQVGLQPAFARHAAAHFCMRIAPAVTHVYQIARGQCAASVAGKGAVAVQAVVRVHHFAVPVRHHADAAAHMDDNKVQLFIGPARVLGKAAGCSLLVQRLHTAFSALSPAGRCRGPAG